MKQLLVMLMLLCSPMVFAQDVIVKKDGSTILSKVIEIGTSVVKYKKFSNQNGPTYNINKTEIMSINYENGEKDTFDDALSVNRSNNSSKDKNDLSWNIEDLKTNKFWLDSYNNCSFKYIGKVSNKKAKYQYRVLKCHKDSRISNSRARVNFWTHSSYDEKFSGKKVLTTELTITVNNSTDKVMYIDLANSFFKEASNSRSMFVNSSTETSKGKNVGVGVNAGSVLGAVGGTGVIGSIANGVNIGGGKSSSTSTTIYSDRIVAIAPHSNRELPKLLFYKSESGEYNLPNYYSLEGDEKRSVGSIQKFEEPYSVENCHWGVIIAYSFYQDFSTFDMFNIGLYVSDAVGLPGIGWNGGPINTDRYFSYGKEKLSNGMEINLDPEFYIYRAK